MAAFVYIGDHEETVTRGHRFVRGEPVEVTSEADIAKLRTNADFSEVVDGVELTAPKRRGRPPKAR